LGDGLSTARGRKRRAIPVGNGKKGAEAKRGVL